MRDVNRSISVYHDVSSFYDAGPDRGADLPRWSINRMHPYHK